MVYIKGHQCKFFSYYFQLTASTSRLQLKKKFNIIMELVKLSLLSVLAFVVAVDCRRLSKLEKLDNVLSETSELLDQLKREGS